jgi:hypothetical protein
LIYSALYIFVILFNRTIIQNLISSQLKMIILSYVNTFGFLMFAFIYYPRKLPSYFAVYYDEEGSFQEIKFNIYGVKLGFNSLAISEGDLEMNNGGSYLSCNVPISGDKISKKEIKEIKENKSIPVVIVNPIFENEINKNEMNLLNHVYLGLRSNT